MFSDTLPSAMGRKKEERGPAESPQRVAFPFHAWGSTRGGPPGREKGGGRRDRTKKEKKKRTAVLELRRVPAGPGEEVQKKKKEKGRLRCMGPTALTNGKEGEGEKGPEVGPRCCLA